MFMYPSGNFYIHNYSKNAITNIWFTCWMTFLLYYFSRRFNKPLLISWCSLLVWLSSCRSILTANPSVFLYIFNKPLRYYYSTIWELFSLAKILISIKALSLCLFLLFSIFRLHYHFIALYISFLFDVI